MKINNDGNWHKGCHDFDEPSIHGLLLSYMCQLIRFVWKLCIEEVQLKMTIRNIDGGFKRGNYEHLKK
jgi:hypothetical protein